MNNYIVIAIFAALIYAVLYLIEKLHDAKLMTELDQLTIERLHSELLDVYQQLEETTHEMRQRREKQEQAR